ncbi:MAG TPA: nuclear transport factor 2 family protein [Amycolatopsis sp.]|nr:nuclear transport factor 2 family protein [Amycolatopsis sp.]
MTTAHDQICRTLAEFCHATDGGDFAAWVRLFTEDGAFHLLGQTYRGRAELDSFIRQDQPPERRGLHLTTDALIDVAGDTATVECRFLFVAAGSASPVLVACGLYHDRLVRAGERWLFQDRECALFAPPATAGWGGGADVANGHVPWWAVTRATPADQRQAPPA